jgi:hypothetical protein
LLHVVAVRRKGKNVESWVSHRNLSLVAGVAFQKFVEQVNDANENFSVCLWG